MRAAAIKYRADQDVAKAEKQNKKYCVTNKICTSSNVKEKNDLVVSSAQKKLDEIFEAVYSKPSTESVPSTSL